MHFVFIYERHRAHAPYRTPVSLKSVTSYRLPTKYSPYTHPKPSLLIRKYERSRRRDKNQTTKSF